MLNDLTILAQASALARHADLRHKLVAENIANADTPGYKAKTLPAFDPQLAEEAENGSTIAASQLTTPIEMRTRQASPDGNTVTVEEQMTVAIDAQGQHKAALAIYRKSLELLKLSVSHR